MRKACEGTKLKTFAVISTENSASQARGDETHEVVVLGTAGKVLHSCLSVLKQVYVHVGHVYFMKVTVGSNFGRNHVLRTYTYLPIYLMYSHRSTQWSYTHVAGVARRCIEM